MFIAVNSYFTDAQVDQRNKVINKMKKTVRLFFLIKFTMYIGKSLGNQKFKHPLISVENLFQKQIHDGQDSGLLI